MVVLASVVFLFFRGTPSGGGIAEAGVPGDGVPGDSDGVGGAGMPLFALAFGRGAFLASGRLPPAIEVLGVVAQGLKSVITDSSWQDDVEMPSGNGQC